MIKKLKENFLILLISNMLTIIMVVVAPRIHGAIANLMVTVPDSDFGFSLPMIFYYISFAIIVCAFICLRKPQAVRDIVINNTVSSSESSISDVEKAEEMHKGIDIQAKHDNVLATEDKGKVTQVNNNPNTAGGLSVTVEYNRNDGSKFQCTYMHLSSIAVKTGDTVNAGQRLGVTGNTGTRTTGEHLHFGVKSISADGKARDIDPAAYLAEISQKGNIQLQTLHNGKDITAQYKVSNPASQGEVTDTAQSPEDWMKKLLSSEDSGVKMPGNDPVIEMAMTMFTSLMALALQIDNKSEEEKMQKVTDSVVSKSIDLSSLLPSYKACSVNIQDGKPYLHVNNATVQFTRELTQAEMTKLQQTLSNADLSTDDKRRGVASIIQAATVSQQMSQNYQKGVDNQQDRQESIQIK